MRDAFWALVLILSENKKGRHLKKVTAKMCGIEKWFVLHFCTNHFVHRNLTKYFSKKLKFFRVAHSKLGAKALSFSSSPHCTWKRWEDIFFSCSQKWTRKNPETVAASGFSGAISFLVAQCGCGRRTRTSDLRVMSPTSYQLLYPAIFGAGDRDRTGTGSLPRDFKSRASANSATPASGVAPVSQVLT